MKYIRFILILVIAHLANTSHSQDITYKNLIGRWDKVDSKDGKFGLQFIDSSTLKIISSKGDISKGTFKLNREGDLVKLTIESHREGIKVFDDYYINLMNAVTLKMENLNTYDPIVQMKPVNTTLLLRKRKI